MSSSISDNVLPAVRTTARVRASTLIGRCGLTGDDREDVEAQLLLNLCSRLGKFDESRSSLRTFASRVMETEVASILRYRLAQRRLHLGRPELSDGDPIPDSGHDASASPAERLEFWLDVGSVTKTLPEKLQETVRALRYGSPTEAGQNLGTARSVVYRRIARIRKAFLAAGIGPAYFRSGGGR